MYFLDPAAGDTVIPAMFVYFRYFRVYDRTLCAWESPDLGFQLSDPAKLLNLSAPQSPRLQCGGFNINLTMLDRGCE